MRSGIMRIVILFGEQRRLERNYDIKFNKWITYTPSGECKGRVGMKGISNCAGLIMDHLVKGIPAENSHLLAVAILTCKELTTFDHHFHYARYPWKSIPL